MYNAAAGQQYLKQYVTLVESGTTLDELAEHMATTGAFISLYPTTLSSVEFATAWLGNALGGTVTDPANVQRAVDIMVYEINQGGSRAYAIKEFTALLIYTDNSDPVWGAASAKFENKMISAANYSETESSLNLSVLQSAISTITEDETTIYPGNNADTITTSYYMDDSILRTGSGADTLTITSSAALGTSIIATNANIYTGDGADIVTVNFILNYLVFDTGSGADTVTMEGAQGGAILCTGTGNDTVTINSSLQSSSLYTGAGNDTLTVPIVNTSKIDAGNGNNTVSMTTIEDSTILAGDGNDTIRVYSTMDNSLFNAGNGNNTVKIWNVQGTDKDTSVSTGSNADSIIITKMGGSVDIDTGAGTDTLKLVLVEDGFNGNVNLGSENDTLTMHLASSSTLPADTIVDGGNGFDTLTLSGVSAADWNNGLFSNFFNFETVSVNGINMLTNLNYRDGSITPDITVESSVDAHNCAIEFIGLYGPQ